MYAMESDSLAYENRPLAMQELLHLLACTYNDKFYYPTQDGFHSNKNIDNFLQYFDTAGNNCVKMWNIRLYLNNERIKKRRLMNP